MSVYSSNINYIIWLGTNYCCKGSKKQIVFRVRCQKGKFSTCLFYTKVMRHQNREANIYFTITNIHPDKSKQTDWQNRQTWRVRRNWRQTWRCNSWLTQCCWTLRGTTLFWWPWPYRPSCLTVRLSDILEQRQDFKQWWSPKSVKGTLFTLSYFM